MPVIFGRTALHIGSTIGGYLGSNFVPIGHKFWNQFFSFFIFFWKFVKKIVRSTYVLRCKTVYHDFAKKCPNILASVLLIFETPFCDFLGTISWFSGHHFGKVGCQFCALKSVRRWHVIRFRPGTFFRYPLTGSPIFFCGAGYVWSIFSRSTR